MSALDCVTRLLSTHLPQDDLRYCLVDENKNPYRVDRSRAASNKKEDFVEFNALQKCPYLNLYSGIGISVQFSGICGIDVDHCFTKARDFSSADDRAKDILNLFKNFSYIEFSFSGKGMRVLFRAPSLENYKEIYYIKNTNKQLEYYQPSYGKESISYRYLTLTGNTIINNPILTLGKPTEIQALYQFLDKYMKRPKPLNIRGVSRVFEDDRELPELMKIVKSRLLHNYSFQDNWFNVAPGSGSNESERDYWMCSYIFKNITKDPKKIIAIFEQSPFYKSKDFKHLNKWNNKNHSYFYYMYDKIRETE